METKVILSVPYAAPTLTALEVRNAMEDIVVANIFTFPARHQRRGNRPDDKDRFNLAVSLRMLHIDSFLSSFSPP